MTPAAVPREAVWLRDHARSILLGRFSPDSCIESTAAALDFLRSRGVEAIERAVSVAVFNTAAWRLLGAGSEVNRSPVDGAAWDLAGAHSVGLGLFDGPMPRPGRYGGHLVAIVERRWLLDLSLDQASRPERGIVLGPTLVAIDDAGLDERVIVERRNAVLVYESLASIWGEGYRAAPGWTRKAQRRAVLHDLEVTYAGGVLP